jgi:aminotransferase EvaB
VPHLPKCNKKRYWTEEANCPAHLYLIVEIGIGKAIVMQKIPLWSYAQEYAALRPEILAACDRVFSSGRLILGDAGQNFEAQIAARAGVFGAVGVNSGTDAIYIALAALGVRAGDEVITVPNTAVPTVSAIVTLGARPVFVDINEDFLMNPSLVEAAVTPKTRAIIPVHLYGQCADLDPLLDIARRHGLGLVEDVAQAQGAVYKGRAAGSLGDAATLSFYPTKTLGAYGDAGMVLVSSEELLEAVRSLRYYGMKTTYYAERHGFNSRLDEVQAAILTVKLAHLDGWIARRREIAARYTAAFAGTDFKPPTECAYGKHVYHLYVIEHARRDALLQHLSDRGIGTGIHYRWPLHTMSGYQHLGYEKGRFPVAERKAERVLSLPLYPQLDDDQVDEVIAAVKAFR